MLAAFFFSPLLLHGIWRYNISVHSQQILTNLLPVETSGVALFSTNSPLPFPTSITQLYNVATNENFV